MCSARNEESIVFHPFDSQSDVEQTARNLPHWFQPGVAVFITFRTIDSMPRAVIERWQSEQEQWLAQNHLDTTVATDLAQLSRLPRISQREFRKLRDQLWHRSLDNCHGDCLLRRPEFNQIVGDTLQHFDGVRYDLDSYVVMPNHVHLLVQFRPLTTLKAQVASWLRFSARQINKLLGKQGAFWQSEPFDHLVRSVDQFEYLRRYIVENPIKANLREGEYLYWSRIV